MGELQKLSEDRAVALLVIDQQMDFEPGGALPVAGGTEIVKPIADLMRKFPFIVVTQDSHPPDHISFASSYQNKKPYDLLTLAEVEAGKVSGIYSRDTLVEYLRAVPEHRQVLWPDHCVVGTTGWFMDPQLPLERSTLILRKGVRKNCDSYSAFFENDGTSTGLSAFLKARGIRCVVTVGLAGDYCVFYSAEDARKEGFDVYFDPEFTRFVDFPKGSREKALEILKQRGARIVSL